MKKGIFKNYLFIITAVFFMNACNDPIFYAVSKEVAPIKPKIGGGPTNFAVFKEASLQDIAPSNRKAMYVASRSNLWMYRLTDDDVKSDSTGDIMKWFHVPASALEPAPYYPPGYFLQLASTDEFLFALTYEDNEHNTPLYLSRFDGEKWESMPSPDGIMQYISTVNDMLFIGAVSNKIYSVYYVKGDSNTINPINTPSGLSCEISGVTSIGTDYFISTRGQGVFKISEGNLSANAVLIDSENKPEIAGMINIEANKIVAISKSGRLFSIIAEPSGYSFTDLKVSIKDRTATGALAVWVNPTDSSNRLLLAGRQESLTTSTNSGFTYGYLELELDSSKPYGIKMIDNPNYNNALPEDENNKKFICVTFTEPGINHPNSSISDYERYLSTIGKNPVNHIYQVESDIDDKMILFASTQKNGVWSYRPRNGEDQWNAEN